MNDFLDRLLQGTTWEITVKICASANILRVYMSNEGDRTIKPHRRRHQTLRGQDP